MMPGSFVVRIEIGLLGENWAGGFCDGSDAVALL